MVDGMSYPKDVTDQHCEACAEPKCTGHPFQKQVLRCIVTDVCGPRVKIQLEAVNKY